MLLFQRNKYSHLKGRKEEAFAEKYLKRQGLKLIEKNYHCRYGEIDLIMKDHADVVFIEVRSRKKQAQVSAIESINHQKVAKIIKTAQHYLIQFKVLPNCRFDVVAITVDKKSKQYHCEWIKNAF